MVWQRPAYVQSAIVSCTKFYSLERPSMFDVLQDPAWIAVATTCTRHMRWDAECRLRVDGWYSFHTTFRYWRRAEPEMQYLHVLLKQQILKHERSKGCGPMADADWL